MFACEMEGHVCKFTPVKTQTKHLFPFQKTENNNLIAKHVTVASVNPPVCGCFFMMSAYDQHQVHSTHLLFNTCFDQYVAKTEIGSGEATMESAACDQP